MGQDLEDIVVHSPPSASALELCAGRVLTIMGGGGGVVDGFSDS